MNNFYLESSITQDRKENKISTLKQKKENTIHSLKEVECFLTNFKKICNGVKLFNIIKH